MARVIPNFVVPSTEMQLANTHERLLDAYLEQLGLATSPKLFLEEVKSVFNTVAPAGYEVGIFEEEAEEQIKEEQRFTNVLSLYDDGAQYTGRASVH
jgi:hypothetical protein